MRSLSKLSLPDRVSSDDDAYRDFMTCCDDLGRLASDDEYEAWAGAQEAGRYPDECPEAPDGDSYEPGEDDLAFLREGGASC